jgi:hypothetical protein
MENKSITCIALVIFIAAAVGFGFCEIAQAFAGNGACVNDLQSYCRDVRPGQGRILKCMEEHENNLSPGCKANLATMEKEHPCADDIIRYCGNIQRGEGRIVQCLKENENQLTPQCNAKIQAQHQKRTRQ